MRRILLLGSLSMRRTGYRDLAASGTQYARRVLRGEEPLLSVPLRSFAGELFVSFRPHFVALPCFAALAGAADHAEALRLARIPDEVGSWLTLRTTVAALVCGLGWGVGQIVNDLMDVESDAINAPERPISAGRLPVGPALLFAILLGVVLAALLGFVHRLAWLLGIPAAALLVFYNAAKRRPVLGNLAHGALMSVAAAIGVSSRLWLEELDSRLGPTTFLESVLSLPAIAVVGAIAAWYLQSNYEKDRPGDRAAGYRTLAVILPVRASAVLRATGIVAIAVWAYEAGLLPDAVSRTTMAAATVLGLVSTVGPIAQSTDRAALSAYRFAVVSTILCLLALAAPLLGRWMTSALLVVALLLVCAAFRRSENP
jgi:4-hydroxybenzoate polyprenyltransferase